MRTTLFSLLLTIVCSYIGYSQKFTGIIIDSKADTIHAEFKKPYKLKDGKGIMFRTPLFDKFNQLYTQGYEKVIIDDQGEYHKVQLPGMRDPKWGRLMIDKGDVTLYQYGNKVYRKTPDGFEEVGAGNKETYYYDAVQKILENVKTPGAIERRLNYYYKNKKAEYKRSFTDPWIRFEPYIGGGYGGQSLKLNYKNYNKTNTWLTGPTYKLLTGITFPRLRDDIYLFVGVDMLTMDCQNSFYSSKGSTRYTYNLKFNGKELYVPVSLRLPGWRTKNFELLYELGFTGRKFLDVESSVKTEVLDVNTVHTELADLEIQDQLQLGMLTGIHTKISVKGINMYLGGQLIYHDIDEKNAGWEIDAFTDSFSYNVSLLIGF
ncbi:hypothetical protein EYV94_06700 [Puteibacter caeruleilacunae]|nr:hypothetical protein EYV94_06700 [Puteibacter caeruleilacunae]